MSIAIKVENLSKIYQIGEIGTGTLSRDMERWWVTKVMGKEDPFLKIGQINDRSKKGESDIVFSLQDINFEIAQGDAVGIIGKNGAGKSTLLKILSRITSPTTGKIQMRGRVASLLEVGTGFHGELTGRENIYLNGAILGMRKKEITRKLAQIVDFSGIERYIDTPVKRYSSGMYVRLAFAVAAHLESEILIVDEVLAVGDAEFQKKCLGKMGEVSKGEGRTVLFVSHNMNSISNFCAKSILMEHGNISMFGQTTDVIKNYLIQNNLNSKNIIEDNLSISDGFNFISAKIEQTKNDEITFELNFITKKKYNDCRLGLYIKDEYECIIASYVTPDIKSSHFNICSKGSSKVCLILKNVNLVGGTYLFTFWLKSKSDGMLIRSKHGVTFSFEILSKRWFPIDGGNFYFNGEVISL
jgi:lipopolysaccharide transport system ATP-binding protein